MVTSSVPNQKIVIISKEPCDKEHLYTPINLMALQMAALNLKGETFKLWLYFSKNKDGHLLELSQKDAENWGIKKDAYYAGVKALAEKGYLVPIDGSPTKFLFSEKPKKSE